MTTKVSMPQLGESVVEGTVGKWLVSEGDAVAKDQPIVEILTDNKNRTVAEIRTAFGKFFNQVGWSRSASMDKYSHSGLNMT